MLRSLTSNTRCFALALLSAAILLTACSTESGSEASSENSIHFAPMEVSLTITDGSTASIPGIIFTASDSHPIWESQELTLDGTPFPAKIQKENIATTPYGKLASASIDISTLSPGTYTAIGVPDSNKDIEPNTEIKVYSAPANTGDIKLTGNFSAVSPHATYFKAGIQNTSQDTLSSFDFSLGLSGIHINSVKLCGAPLSEAIISPGQTCQLEANLTDTNKESHIYVGTPVLEYQRSQDKATFTMPFVQYGTASVNEHQLAEWFKE